MTKHAWVQKCLLGWYAKHRRDLPWRKTHDPYRILVSEIMLQQTQVSRVIPKYLAFVREFPTLQQLAKAPQGKVITMWSGLGYNRRARNLQQLAIKIVQDYAGVLPRTPQALRELPGIGPYTAAAVACFAFGAPVALVDVNVRRVLGRVMQGVNGPTALSETAMWALAAALVPKQSVTWNSALMDFGATVCTARTPKCATCPLQAKCVAYPEVLNTPPKVAKIKPAFAGSDRYWRGKILLYLQSQPKQSTATETLESVFQRLGLPKRRLLVLVERLANEHLLQLHAKTVRL